MPNTALSFTYMPKYRESSSDDVKAWPLTSTRMARIRWWMAQLFLMVTIILALVSWALHTLR